jgi:hypothetical protein
MLSLLNIPGLRSGLYATDALPASGKNKSSIGEEENQCITFVGVAPG